MFEEYLEDTRAYRNLADNADSVEERQRYSRSAVFCAMSALEAFVNYHAEAFKIAGTLPPHEIAFLNDESYTMSKTGLELRVEYHRLEDKLRFLFLKFDDGFDFGKDANWSCMLELKRLRDGLVHPRTDSDEMPPAEYRERLERGVPAVFGVVNQLCVAIVGKPLRLGLMEMA